LQLGPGVNVRFLLGMHVHQGQVYGSGEVRPGGSA
jgi:hypothetical protein